MKLHQRILHFFKPAPHRISRHTLRDIGRDPMALRYGVEVRSQSDALHGKDPWSQAC
ncbi:MAG: hypothetical protein HWE39_03395 [Oceanospirillaceae bacterium]|nr:hypothetical protein [Oceanospirillaceae bacterium]